MASAVGCGDVCTTDSNFSQLAGAVSSCIFETLPLYNDRASQNAVEAVIRQSLSRDPSFVKAFTATLAMTAVRCNKGAPPGVQYKVLRWIFLLLETSPEVLQSKAAISKLVGVQASLLTAVLQSGKGARNGALRLFGNLMRKVGGGWGRGSWGIDECIGFRVLERCGILLAGLKVAAST